MSTTIRVYADEAAAMRAAQQLMAAGVPANDIQLIQATQAQIDGQERIGTFNDEDASRERVGSFDNQDARTVREGNFDDTESHLHNVREEPKGSFANIDGLPRVTSGDIHRVAHSAGFEQSRVDQALRGATASSVALIVNTQSLASADAERVLG